MQSRHPIGAGLASMAILFSVAFNHNALASGFADFITYPQAERGGDPILSTPTPFSTVFPSGLLVGLVPPGQGSMEFSNGPAVLNYLPAAGPSGALAHHTSDPSVTESGQFGGEMVALTLNIAFADAGITLGSSGIPFGDLVLANFIFPAEFNGMSVRYFLEMANIAIGGGTTGFSIPVIVSVTAELNAAFYLNGIPTTWAQEHLRIACPADLNSDLAVDVNDLLLLIGAWGASGANVADINGDNAVDVNDLLTLIGGWGPCPVVGNIDNCATAASIGTGNTALIQWDNTFATHDGLPTPRTCNIFGDTDISRDLWFLWTAGPDADGFVRVQTCTDPGFDNKMAMYNYPTACPPTAAPVACADDGICAFSRAAFDVAIVPGQQYLIRVGSYNDSGPTGLGTLQILQNNPQQEAVGNGQQAIEAECRDDRGAGRAIHR